MSILNEIGLKHQTDKASEIHNYLVKYEKYLPFNRDKILNILEIGVLNGSSLKTWKDYFYNSQILGIDINPDCRKFEEERIIIEIGSQNDANFINKIGNSYGLFDLIIDDGSHINEDILFSFKHLWSYVRSGGIYVVEDSCTSYWSEYKFGSNDVSAVNYFKKIVDDVNFRGVINYNKTNVYSRRDDWCIENAEYGCITDIESINFLNGIIIITKR
jgi:hypothetical protein